MITHLEKFPWILKHQQTSVSFLHSMQGENLDTVGMETWETKTNSLFGEGGGSSVSFFCWVNSAILKPDFLKIVSPIFEKERNFNTPGTI